MRLKEPGVITFQYYLNGLCTEKANHLKSGVSGNRDLRISNLDVMRSYFGRTISFVDDFFKTYLD